MDLLSLSQFWTKWVLSLLKSLDCWWEVEFSNILFFMFLCRTPAVWLYSTSICSCCCLTPQISSPVQLPWLKRVPGMAAFERSYKVERINESVVILTCWPSYPPPVYWPFHIFPDCLFAFTADKTPNNLKRFSALIMSLLSPDVIYVSAAGSMLCQIINSLLLLPVSVARPLLSHLLDLLPPLDRLNRLLPAASPLEDQELQWPLHGEHETRSHTNIKSEHYALYSPNFGLSCCFFQSFYIQYYSITNLYRLLNCNIHCSV